MRISKMGLNYFLHDLRLQQRVKHGMELSFLEDASRYLNLAEIVQFYIATSRLVEDQNLYYQDLVFETDKKEHNVFTWAHYTLKTGRNRVRKSKDNILAPLTNKARNHIINLNPFPANTIGSRVALIGKELYQVRKQLKKHFFIENPYTEGVGQQLIRRPIKTGNRLQAPPRDTHMRYKFRVQTVTEIVQQLLIHPEHVSREQVITYIQNRKPKNYRQQIMSLQEEIRSPKKPLIHNYLKEETTHKIIEGIQPLQYELFDQTQDERWEQMGA